MSSTDQNDHKQIIKVKCLDGLTIQPVFEEPKAKVLTRAAATTPKSVSVLNAPAVLSDTVNDKLVTLSGLAKFKEKCDEKYLGKTEAETKYLTKTQASDDYYTKAFCDMTFPTKDYCDTNYALKSEIGTGEVGEVSPNDIPNAGYVYRATITLINVAGLKGDTSKNIQVNFSLLYRDNHEISQLKSLRLTKSTNPENDLMDIMRKIKNNNSPSLLEQLFPASGTVNGNPVLGVSLDYPYDADYVRVFYKTSATQNKSDLEEVKLYYNNSSCLAYYSIQAVQIDLYHFNS